MRGTTVVVLSGVIMRNVVTAIQGDRENIALAAAAADKLEKTEQELADMKSELGELVLQRTNHLTHIQDSTSRMVELQMETNGYLRALAEGKPHH